MRTFIAVVVIASFAGAAAAADAPIKKWKDSAEISFVTTNGNTKGQTTSAKNMFVYDFDATNKLEQEAGGFGARNEGQVTAEQYFASEKYAHKVDDRNYLFERYRWDRNRFSGVAHRHDFSAGAGREVWKTEKNLWIVEVAPGYLNEERFNEKRNTYAASRAYTRYTYDFRPGTRFSQDAEYVQSLADKRDNRLATETGLSASLTRVFSIKNSFIWKHDSRPPQNKTKDDTIFSVALLASF